MKFNLIFVIMTLIFSSAQAAINECSDTFYESKRIFSKYPSTTASDLLLPRKMIGCTTGDIYREEKQINCKDSSIQDSDPNTSACRDGWYHLPGGEVVSCTPVYNYSYCRISSENRNRMICAITETSTTNKDPIDYVWADIAGFKCFDLVL